MKVALGQAFRGKSQMFWDHRFNTTGPDLHWMLCHWTYPYNYRILGTYPLFHTLAKGYGLIVIYHDSVKNTVFKLLQFDFVNILHSISNLWNRGCITCVSSRWGTIPQVSKFCKNRVHGFAHVVRRVIANDLLSSEMCGQSHISFMHSCRAYL